MNDAGAAKLPITAIILAFNEEIHIERCLTRIVDWVERIVVIDSFSTDRTVEIATGLGAEVLQRQWKNHADQFRWGLEAAAPVTPWVMRIDADEYFEPTVPDALRAMLPSLDAEVTGINVKRKFIFRERWIRHGRYYPTILLRLWRASAGEIEQRWMDEHIVLTRGRGALLEGGDLVDHNLNDLDAWIAKHNRYATLAMVDYLNRDYRLFDEDRRIDAMDGAARRNRFLKNSVYGRMPLYFRALAMYVYRYVFRLGFLDGRAGLVFHFMHGFWLFMLIDAKLDEARDFIARHGVEAFKRRLSQTHNIDL
ncbi:MAG: glycosyltransferase family 2 protein [Bradyrhizobium sp.]|nr:MAG: glycosyltransferase family 2 protein [Bradyrhizobium sp.]